MAVEASLKLELPTTQDSKWLQEWQQQHLKHLRRILIWLRHMELRMISLSIKHNMWTMSINNLQVVKQGPRLKGIKSLHSQKHNI